MKLKLNFKSIANYSDYHHHVVCLVTRFNYMARESLRSKYDDAFSEYTPLLECLIIDWNENIYLICFKTFLNRLTAQREWNMEKDEI